MLRQPDGRLPASPSPVARIARLPISAGCGTVGAAECQPRSGLRKPAVAVAIGTLEVGGRFGTRGGLPSRDPAVAIGIQSSERCLPVLRLDLLPCRQRQRREAQDHAGENRSSKSASHICVDLAMRKKIQGRSGVRARQATDAANPRRRVHQEGTRTHPARISRQSCMSLALATTGTWIPCLAAARERARYAISIARISSPGRGH
jgi:hypothetical protein